MSKRMTTEEFVEKAKRVHGEKYDYSQTVYLGDCNKVTVNCLEHGVFFQSPSNHLAGHGCRKCSGIRDTVQFISKAQQKHGNRYDYSQTEFIGSGKKVKIICREHGVFEQLPNDHINGHGCKVCSGNNTKTTEEFIDLANKVHNSKYFYLEKYKMAHKKIAIKCPEHGIFYQSPHHHLAGHGCPDCFSRVSRGEKEWLEYMEREIGDKIQRQIFFKINENRFEVDGFDPKTNTVYEYNGDFFHGNPWKFEPQKRNNVTNCSFAELHIDTILKRIHLREAGYNVVSIWEADWKKMREEQK